MHPLAWTILATFGLFLFLLPLGWPRHAFFLPAAVAVLGSFVVMGDVAPLAGDQTPFAGALALAALVAAYLRGISARKRLDARPSATPSSAAAPAEALPRPAANA